MWVFFMSSSALLRRVNIWNTLIKPVSVCWLIPRSVSLLHSSAWLISLLFMGYTFLLHYMPGNFLSGGRHCDVSVVGVETFKAGSWG